MSEPIAGLEAPTIMAASLRATLLLALTVAPMLAAACGTDDSVVFAAAHDGSAGDDASDDAGRDGPRVDTCPAYTSLCNGACIPTVSDPSNCGACGVACTGSLACSGGTCSETCLPGLTKCGNTCTDTSTDNVNCGACGAPPCAPGTGCVDGACHPVVPVTGSAPAHCAGGASSPALDPAHGGCAGKIAQTVFRWALCSCKDAKLSGSWLMDAFDSTKGPYQPGGLGAGFGTNENYGASGTGELWGTMWIAGTGGIGASSAHTVKTDVRSGGELKAAPGPFAIGRDAYSEGDVSGVDLSIAGTLHLPSERSVTDATHGALAREPVDVIPPCDFCAPHQQVPTSAIVTSHQSPNNDNASIGLDADAFATPSTPLRLDLPCGHYYLTQIASSSHVAIVAHGRTALYIEGDVSPNGITFAVDPGGELSVFIKGSVNTSGVVRFGSPAYPASMRVYVAGTSGFGISGTVSIAGNLYVPNGPVGYSSNADQYGAIYAGDFSTSGDLSLHYDVAVLGAAGTCGPPPAAGCGTCTDCGNQACVNGACGACTSSEQCCSPLVCAGGSCVPAIR